MIYFVYPLHNLSEKWPKGDKNCTYKQLFVNEDESSRHLTRHSIVQDHFISLIIQKPSYQKHTNRKQ